MNNDRPVDTWGPYRAAIEDHLASCADYLEPAPALPGR